MEYIKLLVQLIEAIAWPGTALVIFFAFRKQLVALLPSIRRFKAGPVEAEFEKEVELISSDQLPRLPSAKDSPDALSRRDQLLRVAQVNPRVAIIDAWQGIEFALKRAALQRFGGSSPPPDISSPVSLIRDLAEEDCLDTSDVSLLHELRGLRNQATHLPDFGPSYESAANYIELAVRTQEKLDELAKIINKEN